MDNEAVNTPITIPYGDTLSKLITYYQPDGVTPVNLDGYTALLIVFDDAGNTMLSLTDADGLIIDGAAGTIQVFSEVIEGTGTAVPPGCYSYYLRISGVSTFGTDHRTLIEGAFIVTPLGGV